MQSDKDIREEMGRIGKILRAVYPKRSRTIITRASEPIGIKRGEYTIVEFAQTSKDIEPKFWYKLNNGRVVNCNDSMIQSLWSSWQLNKTGCSYRKDTDDYDVFSFHQYHIKSSNIIHGAIGSWGKTLKENVESLIKYSKMNHGKKHRLIIKGADNLTELINELDIEEIEIDESIPKGIFYVEQVR